MPVNPPPRLPLLRRQRKQLLDFAAHRGLSLRDFTWETTRRDTKEVDRLSHLGGDFHFDVVPHVRGKFRVYFAPGRQVHNDLAEAEDWEDVLPICSAWIESIRLELETPDVWSGEFPSVGGSASDWSNEPFTAAEQAEIRAGLSRAKEYLGTVGLDASQLAEITDRLDYLSDAVDRLGRFDWRNVAWTVLWDIGKIAALNIDGLTQLAQLVVKPVQGLLGG